MKATACMAFALLAFGPALVCGQEITLMEPQVLRVYETNANSSLLRTVSEGSGPFAPQMARVGSGLVIQDVIRAQYVIPNDDWSLGDRIDYPFYEWSYYALSLDNEHGYVTASDWATLQISDPEYNTHLMIWYEDQSYFQGVEGLAGDFGYAIADEWVFLDVTNGIAAVRIEHGYVGEPAEVLYGEDALRILGTANDETGRHLAVSESGLLLENGVPVTRDWSTFQAYMTSTFGDRASDLPEGNLGFHRRTADGYSIWQGGGNWVVSPTGELVIRMRTTDRRAGGLWYCDENGDMYHFAAIADNLLELRLYPLGEVVERHRREHATEDPTQAQQAARYATVIDGMHGLSPRIESIPIFNRPDSLALKLASLPVGDAVAVREMTEPQRIGVLYAPWYRVANADGAEGWVYGYFLEMEE
jgi:hypothetical protein